MSVDGLFSTMSVDNEWSEFDTKVVAKHKDSLLIEKILFKLNK